MTVMFKTGLGQFGQKNRNFAVCIKSHILILNTKITNGEVLSDSVMLKMELGHFGPKNQNFAYFA